MFSVHRSLVEGHILVRILYLSCVEYRIELNFVFEFVYQLMSSAIYYCVEGGFSSGRFASFVRRRFARFVINKCYKSIIFPLFFFGLSLKIYPNYTSYE